MYCASLSTFIPKVTCTLLKYVLYVTFTDKQQYFKLGLDVPQLLLGFSSLPVGVAQLDRHLIEVGLHLLPDSHGVILAACLGV